MTTYYQITEQDLIDISEALIEANDIIYNQSSWHMSKWEPTYTAVESIIENIVKNNKLYKASLV